MTNKTPRIAKNRRESTSPGTRKTGKLFFFLSSSSSSSSFFRQLSSTLPQSVTMVFARNSSIFNRAVQRPIAFSLPPSLHQAAAAAHSITMASFVTPFSRCIVLYKCSFNRVATSASWFSGAPCMCTIITSKKCNKNKRGSNKRKQLYITEKTQGKHNKLQLLVHKTNEKRDKMKQVLS